MANRFDVKTKTFFQIPPRELKRYQLAIDGLPVVFMDVGFKMTDVIMITEPVMVRDLHYEFSMILTHQEERVLKFEFKRKQDCIMAQRELTRAWTRTGEFSHGYENEDVETGEGTST